jgi:hypothetical protein
MNIDASCYEDGAGAAGAILRNDHGEAIVGSAFLLNRVIYATLAEALGLKGLKWLNKLGVQSDNRIRFFRIDSGMQCGN